MEKIEVNKTQWKIIVWIPIILGAILWIIFNAVVSQALTSPFLIYALWASNIGFLLIGWGFGLAYSRLWKIRGIDTK